MSGRYHGKLHKELAMSVKRSEKERIWAVAECDQFSSATQSCPTLSSPTDCNIPGLPVHHQPFELAQTHVR